jgi:hypothetical protein
MKKQEKTILIFCGREVEDDAVRAFLQHLNRYFNTFACWHQCFKNQTGPVGPETGGDAV